MVVLHSPMPQLYTSINTPLITGLWSVCGLWWVDGKVG